ncbi:cupin domain-containing protein, partial [Pseudomonas aeruginosa]|uniref:cupin domain-containing protein n=1 Tax=Pseudomonas aeruginosa TaxID=287 RepID=UPI00396A02B5
ALFARGVLLLAGAPLFQGWEFCHFLDGYCIITPEGEQPVHLRAGDVFVIEPGLRGTWEVVETVRKYFVFA